MFNLPKHLEKLSDDQLKKEILFLLYAAQLRFSNNEALEKNILEIVKNFRSDTQWQSYEERLDLIIKVKREIIELEKQLHKTFDEKKRKKLASDQKEQLNKLSELCFLNIKKEDLDLPKPKIPPLFNLAANVVTTRVSKMALIVFPGFGPPLFLMHK